MSQSKPERTYTNGEITIEWRPEKCLHCRSCVINLPEVFDTGRRPWVNMNMATTELIRDTVELCPDGALSVTPANADVQTAGEEGAKDE